jgi:hypothetical protein
MCKECYAIPTDKLQLKYGVWVEDSNVYDLEDVLERMRDNLEEEHVDTMGKTMEQYCADMDKLSRAIEEEQEVEYMMFPVWFDIADKGNVEFLEQIWLVKFEGDELFTSFILTHIRNQWNYWRKTEYESGTAFTWNDLQSITKPDDHKIIGLYMTLPSDMRHIDELKHDILLSKKH